MPRIACLHTADSNIQVFDMALQELGMEGVKLHHSVRADLLADAEKAGGLRAQPGITALIEYFNHLKTLDTFLSTRALVSGWALTPGIAERTAAVLRGLCDGADAVLLTCSTLGPAAEAAAVAASVPVVRVDDTFAREAVRGGGKVAVLCAVQTTMEPTRLLFEKEARATGAEVVMHFVPGAWDVFKAGDGCRYLSMIAAAADEAFQDGAAQVVLAQASMAGAAKLATGGRAPLTSPTVGLAAAIEAAAAQP